ncbi:MAG: tyrosine-protein phosphatase [Ruminococcus sp.]|nr:tyrosine-protein phosphatase [Ruminococcus sp.]
MNTTEFPHSIGLKGVANARELGGYKTIDGREVVSGVLLRTGKLSQATAEDLKKLTNEYKVAAVIDLRSAEEINGSPEVAVFTGTADPDPDPQLDGVRRLNLPVLDMQRLIKPISAVRESSDLSALEAVAKADVLGDTLYYTFVDDEPGRGSYAKLFRELLSLEEGRALLVHCSQGKDRTGVAAMLILTALGVSEQTVLDDYLLTNTYNSERIAAKRAELERAGLLSADNVAAMLSATDSVNISYMTSLIAHINERCGSVMGYITGELGITADEIAKLREKFLIPPPAASQAPPSGSDWGLSGYQRS